MKTDGAIPHDWPFDRSFYWAGQCGFVLFAIAGIVFAFHPDLSDEGKPLPIPLVAGLLATFISMPFLSIWLFLLGKRGGLTVTGTAVELRRAFGRKTIKFEDIIDVQWSHPSVRNCTVLHARYGRLSIFYRNFAVRDRAEIAGALRDALADKFRESVDEFPMPRISKKIFFKQDVLFKASLFFLIGPVVMFWDIKIHGPSKSLDYFMASIFFFCSLMGSLSLVLLCIWDLIRYHQQKGIVLAALLISLATSTFGVIFVLLRLIRS